jgi:hypothetical protein
VGTPEVQCVCSVCQGIHVRASQMDTWCRNGRQLFVWHGASGGAAAWGVAPTELLSRCLSLIMSTRTLEACRCLYMGSVIWS